MGLKSDTKKILKEVLKSISPFFIVRNSTSFHNQTLHVNNQTYPLKKYKRVFLLGLGQASYEMALVLFDLLEDLIHGGLIVTQNHEGTLGPITMTKGALDVDSLDAGEGPLSFIKELNSKNFCIYILSSGSTQMIESLRGNINLNDFQKLNNILKHSFIPGRIEQSIRKKISSIKVGKLNLKCKAKGVVLVVSGNNGNDLETVGLAPFIQSKRPFIIEDIPFEVSKKISKNILQCLKKEQKVKYKLPPPHHIIASNFLALKATKKEARLGYSTLIVTDNTNNLEGLAVNVARKIIFDFKNTNNKKPICILYGEKTSVDISGSGLGEKNQHMALYALSLLIKNNKDISFLSAITNGAEGNSKGAGACIDHKTYKYALKSSLDIMSHLNKWWLNHNMPSSSRKYGYNYCFKEAK